MIKSDEIRRDSREISPSPPQNRQGAGHIAPGVVHKRDGYLHQTLKESSVAPVTEPPNVLEHFVGLEVFSLVN